MAISRNHWITTVAGISLAILLGGCGSGSSTPSVPATATTLYAHTLKFRNHTAFSWGYNRYGQLGNDDASLENQLKPAPVSGAIGLTGMSAGAAHSLGFKNFSGAWAWGHNGYGQLGNNTVAQQANNTHSRVPVPVLKSATERLTGVTAVSAGGSHSLALVNGTVYAWGSNYYGQLGNGATGVAGTTNTLVASPVFGPSTAGNLTGISAIAAGGNHSLALDNQTHVWAWGHNGNGQLGNNSTIDGTSPVEVFTDASATALANVAAIAAGGSHNLAIVNGAVYAWGNNNMGQLGDGTTTNRLFAVPVTGITGNVVKIAAGLNHSLAVTADGKVWAWGFNFYGQLGNGQSGSNDAVVTPVQVKLNSTTDFLVLTGTSWEVVAIGNQSYAYAGNKGWAWGNNPYGQLGNGGTANSAVAVPIAGFQ